MIPANKTVVVVPVNAIDDALLNGDIDVSLTATAAGLEPDTVELLVKDRERLTAQFSTSSLLESRQAGIKVRVQRSNTNTSLPVVVTVKGGIAGEVELPTKITIPANQTEVSVAFIPIDDSDPELTKDLTYVFSSPGYISGSDSFQLLDDEPPAFQNPLDRYDVTGSGTVRASDALRIINEIARRNNGVLDPEKEQPAGVYLDVNGDYMVTALDALNVINELSNRDADGARIVGSLPAIVATAKVKEAQTQIDLYPGSGTLF